jgi:hypothetical protein
MVLLKDSQPPPSGETNGACNGNGATYGNGAKTYGNGAANGSYSNPWNTLLELKKKLVTLEDYLHVHKILGILVLISFIYRLTQFFDDMGFSSHPELTLPTILVHWLLTVSSFQFRIPPRRIKDGGRIWPQYRWHSLAFTTRSCLCMLLYYYEEKYHLEPHYWINYVILMANMAAVDATNWYYGPEFSSNTIRDVEGPEFVKFFLSSMQFNSMIAILFGLRYFATPFYMLYTIQLTPFIGTLRRKGLFNSNLGGSILYTSLLVGGFTVQSIQFLKAGGEILFLFVRSIALAAALLRLSPLPRFLWPLQNKYVIWTTMYPIVCLVRPILLKGDASTSLSYAPDFLRSAVTDLFTMRIIVASLFSALVLSGFIKVQSGYYPKNVQDAKKTKKL